jgi:hypothetical protein
MSFRHACQEASSEQPDMNNIEPLFDPTTHYRIEVRGRVDSDWLQSFGASAESIIDEVRQTKESTVLHIHTDQSGIVGVLRRLHGLGMTILQLQIVVKD